VKLPSSSEISRLSNPPPPLERPSRLSVPDTGGGRFPAHSAAAKRRRYDAATPRLCCGDQISAATWLGVNQFVVSETWRLAGPPSIRKTVLIAM
jgi:hypothetical protein